MDFYSILVYIYAGSRVSLSIFLGVTHSKFLTPLFPCLTARPNPTQPPKIETPNGTRACTNPTNQLSQNHYNSSRRRLSQIRLGVQINHL